MFIAISVSTRNRVKTSAKESRDREACHEGEEVAWTEPRWDGFMWPSVQSTWLLYLEKRRLWRVRKTKGRSLRQERKVPSRSLSFECIGVNDYELGRRWGRRVKRAGNIRERSCPLRIFRLLFPTGLCTYNNNNKRFVFLRMRRALPPKRRLKPHNSILFDDETSHRDPSHGFRLETQQSFL